MVRTDPTILDGWSPTGSYPETGLEEIDGDLLEEDFWPASFRVRPGGAIPGLPDVPLITLRQAAQGYRADQNCQSVRFQSFLPRTQAPTMGGARRPVLLPKLGGEHVLQALRQDPTTTRISGDRCWQSPPE